MREKERSLHNEILSVGEREFLHTATEEWEIYLEQKYTIDPIILRGSDEIEYDHREIDFDVSSDRLRYIEDRSRPFLIKATEYIYFVPFSGDQELLRYSPATMTLVTPESEVHCGKFQLTYRTTESDADEIKREFDREFTAIQNNITNLNKEVVAFNSSLIDKIRPWVKSRATKLKADKIAGEKLGFRLRKREHGPDIFKLPASQRPMPVRPPRTRTLEDRYWVLENEDYENILDIMTSMVAVMERSPNAFSHLSEPQIRDLLLFPLNGQYRGAATGETFNYGGKTDILIRIENKNIFIAECMFWDGPKSLTDKIDQLLGYISWRDTKTAILIFVRRKGFSKILEQIEPTIMGHQNFLKMLNYKNETASRFVLVHKDDPDRELVLTSLAFPVPSESHR
ncbi:MAG: hypothetical protein IID61_10690 [SAR324 cluster bacterium]|nr:hypothetical protein [SAR324 cluster bacterium]